MTSLMRAETLASADQLRIQLQENLILWQQFAQAFKQRKPKAIMTVARGSSDHAATYAKYLFETELLLPTALAAPSVFSIYKAPVALEDILVIAISQSGQSPDILEVMRYAKTQGAFTLALVNDTSSPLADLAEYVIPLHAGPEEAVAATKSFLLTLSALLQGVAIIKNNTQLQQELTHLPEQLRHIFQLSSIDYLNDLVNANALILGRGFSFSIAQEIALKLKEVTQIHAEAFSSAEVLHGPFSLLSEQLPVLALTQNDASLASMLETLQKIKQADIEPLIFCVQDSAEYFSAFTRKILLPNTSPLLTPVLACALLYLMIEALARTKNLNPDSPPFIQKVTRTH